jgi:hypothetical protein
VLSLTRSESDYGSQSWRTSYACPKSLEMVCNHQSSVVMQRQKTRGRDGLTSQLQVANEYIHVVIQQSRSILQKLRLMKSAKCGRASYPTQVVCFVSWRSLICHQSSLLRLHEEQVSIECRAYIRSRFGRKFAIWYLEDFMDSGEKTYQPVA